MTSRKLVYDTLNFNNFSRAPRQLWVLPWAENEYPEELKGIKTEYKDDIISAPMTAPVAAEGFSVNPDYTEGNPFAAGKYRDPWGCIFSNIHAGVIGEVREPRVIDSAWNDIDKIRLPEEALGIDKDKINIFCKTSDKFVTAGDNIRPFERLQFIRGTESLFMDLLLQPEKMLGFMERLHDYYCRLLKVWASTDVDALLFMDDWGSQDSLLINPELWTILFKPMYKDYVDIAHKNGKKIFMHSDGNILQILPDLIEIGVDAVNSQIFCMDRLRLEDFKGYITFWGEIDRQHILVNGTEADVRRAVKGVYNSLWSNGGCIAQCEFGPGAMPANIRTVFSTWDDVSNNQSGHSISSRSIQRA